MGTVLIIVVVSVACFALLAGWAIFRGPKLYAALLDVRSRRRNLKERRTELVSEALAELRREGAAGIPTRRKPYVRVATTETEEPAVVHGPKLDPWLSILIRPRATIRQIVVVDPQHHVLLLSSMYGMNALLGRVVSRPDIVNVSNWISLLIALVVGSLFGILSVSLVSWFAHTIAEFLGGAATEHETQAALAWSLLPEIYTFPFALAAVLVVSSDLGLNPTSQMKTITLLLFGINSLVSRAWSFVLWINTLAEVNRFSLWKSLATIILAFLAMFFSMVAIYLLFLAVYYVIR
jgi:Yip1 domain